VRIVPAADSAAFALRARSKQPFDATGVPLRAQRRDGEWLRAEYVPRRTAPTARTALLELSSSLARVVIQPQ
jgi:hypothetical protein